MILHHLLKIKHQTYGTDNWADIEKQNNNRNN